MGEMQVGRLNIASAALIAQVLVILVLAFGAALIRSVQWRDSPGLLKFDPALFAWLIVLLAISTLLLLLASNELASLWKPVFGVDVLGEVSFSTAMSLTFLTDIACISFFAYHTRGSRSSEFTAIYFLLPALAIFLREPADRVIWCAVISALALTITLRGSSLQPGRTQLTASTVAYWFVSVACMAIAVLIGLATAPK